MYTPQEITQILQTETKGKKKQQLGIDIRGGGGEDFKTQTVIEVSWLKNLVHRLCEITNISKKL